MKLLLIQLLAGLTVATASLTVDCAACYADIFPGGVDVLCFLPWVQSAITDCDKCAADLKSTCSGNTCISSTSNSALAECAACATALDNVLDECAGSSAASCSGCAVALAKQCGSPAPTACT